MSLALVFLLLNAKPAKPPPPPSEPLIAPQPFDLVDLLDFDQGTIPLVEAKSKGTGVEPGSAFYLTDGNVNVGWSSAEKAALGGEFIYELEQESELTMLRFHNKGTEEVMYPGCSARFIEISVAGAQGDFKKLGLFEVPKGGEKEFPVPEGTKATRIKMVISSNWGHPFFTELMEVDIIGRKVGKRAPIDTAGEYYSPQWKGLRIKQTGNRLEGCYDFNDGSFVGELEGRVARVSWAELVINGKAHARGSATFVLGSDRKSIRGIYFMEGDLAVRGTWDLETAKGPDEKSKCAPPTLSMAEQLKKNGRLVLYGIHFDSGSDRVREDSEPTLNDISAMMHTDGMLKLQIEGHTDATNSDKYNQELSERRAKAVVAWLVKRGVKGSKLIAKGLGRTRPVASNETAQGRALNRRVELATVR